jgi:serine/threonine protein kinase/beta-lactamase class A
MQNFGQNGLISGRYGLVKSLGKGGFGEVYEADDIQFTPPRKVAIKVLHPQFISEPEVRESLKQEAGVLARFDHPNILRVIDFNITPDFAYIVTDLALGGSLMRKIRPDPTKPPIPMPFLEIADYLDQLTEALDEAHEKGLIHRDIKPHNILITQRNRPLLADFGLATAISNSTASVVDAQSSGTPAYMAPEQWRGKVGRPTDIYALGVVTYQMLTGYPPFTGDHFELMGQHLNNEVPPLSFRAPNLRYPPALDEVVARAMAKEYRERIHPAREFARQFRAALTAPINSDVTVAVTKNAVPKIPAPAPVPVVPPMSQPVMNASQTLVEPKEPKKSNKTSLGLILGGVGGLVLIAIIAVVLILALGQSNNATPTVTGNAATATVNLGQTPTVGQTQGFAPTNTVPVATNTPAPDFAATSQALQVTQTAFAGVQATANAPTATPVPPTLTPIPQVQINEAAINNALLGLPGTTSTIVILPNGKTIEDDADRQVASASTIKLWIAGAAFEQAKTGKVNLNDSRSIIGSDVAFGTGCINNFIGRSYTYEELIRVMLTCSDNGAANLIIDKIGGQGVVNAYIQKHGYSQTKLQRRLGDVNNPNNNFTSARDAALFLQRVVKGDIVDRLSSDQILQALAERLTYDADQNYFGRRLGGVAYRHISGTMTGVRNDAGIIFLNNNTPVIIALYVNTPNDVGAETAIANAVFQIYQAVKIYSN